MNEPMDRRKINVVAVFALTALISLFSCAPKTGRVDFRKGQYWKDQVINDILPYWTDHAQDTIHGGFMTTLDSVWKPYGDTRKYPSMLSRHVFGYSVGYLLSGDRKYLDIARQTVDYLLKHAWDQESGGWYDALDEQGKPVETTKSMFVQVYSITGLAMYYFVTRDPQILEIINRSNDLLESRGWDPVEGGYYNVLTRDWQVLDRTKSISSEITPVSGYLFYLYLATHDQKYLDQSRKILDVVTQKMTDPQSGWILETFRKDWRYLPGPANETEISTGHNIEVAWMLYRYYLITGDQKYLEIANQLSDKVYRYCNRPDDNFWYNTIGRLEPQKFSGISYWWVQAYGIMFDLYSYRISNQDRYLDDYQKGASFWDSRFVDRIHGDTYLSVLADGTIRETTKANRYKASYHNCENGLLNYLYLNAWVNHDPVELFFYIADYQSDKEFYASPIEGDNLKIKRITILKESSPINASRSNSRRVKVELQTIN
jgi:mannobiose 2-epimerase